MYYLAKNTGWVGGRSSGGSLHQSSRGDWMRRIFHFKATLPLTYKYPICLLARKTQTSPDVWRTRGVVLSRRKTLCSFWEGEMRRGGWGGGGQAVPPTRQHSHVTLPIFPPAGFFLQLVFSPPASDNSGSRRDAPRTPFNLNSAS